MQRFIETKLGQKILREVDEFVKGSKSKGTKVIHFEVNEKFTSSNLKAESLGEIHIVTTKTADLPLKIKSKTYFNVKIPTDMFKCRITGVCQLADGLIVLSDYNNKNLKCFDITHKLEGCHGVGKRPLGVCHTSNK